MAEDEVFGEKNDIIRIRIDSMPIIRQASGTGLAAYCEAGVGQ